MTYNQSIVFIETTIFTKLVKFYMNDDEYRELQQYLMHHPDDGNIIRGSNGLRKLRWSRMGMGKSSGIRIIYFWSKLRYQIYMLTIYSKSDHNNIDNETLLRIAKSLEGLK